MTRTLQRLEEHQDEVPIRSTQADERVSGSTCFSTVPQDRFLDRSSASIVEESCLVIDGPDESYAPQG